MPVAPNLQSQYQNQAYWRMLSEGAGFPGADYSGQGGYADVPPGYAYDYSGNLVPYSFDQNPLANIGGQDIANFGQYADYFGAPIGYQSSFAPSTFPTVEVPTDQSFQGVSMPQDFSQTPGDVFGGLPDPVPSFTEPGALGDPTDPFAGAIAGGSPGTYDPFSGANVSGSSGSTVDPFSGAVVDGSSGTTINADGTATPYAYAPPPDPLPFGMSPGQETGVFAPAGPFSTPGVGPQFSSNTVDSGGVGLGFDVGSLMGSAVGGIHGLAGGPMSELDPNLYNEGPGGVGGTPVGQQRYATGWTWIHGRNAPSTSGGWSQGWWEPTGWTTNAMLGFLMPQGGKNTLPMPVMQNPTAPSTHR